LVDAPLGFISLVLIWHCRWDRWIPTCK
jgi:hypothetical protein